jgi:hypothetical protein
MPDQRLKTISLSSHSTSGTSKGSNPSIAEPMKRSGNATTDTISASAPSIELSTKGIRPQGTALNTVGLAERVSVLASRPPKVISPGPTIARPTVRDRVTQVPTPDTSRITPVAVATGSTPAQISREKELRDQMRARKLMNQIKPSGTLAVNSSSSTGLSIRGAACFSSKESVTPSASTASTSPSIGSETLSNTSSTEQSILVTDGQTPSQPTTKQGDRLTLLGTPQADPPRQSVPLSLPTLEVDAPPTVAKVPTASSSAAAAPIRPTPLANSSNCASLSKSFTAAADAASSSYVRISSSSSKSFTSSSTGATAQPPRTSRLPVRALDSSANDHVPNSMPVTTPTMESVDNTMEPSVAPESDLPPNSSMTKPKRRPPGRPPGKKIFVGPAPESRQLTVKGIDGWRRRIEINATTTAFQASVLLIRRYKALGYCRPAEMPLLVDGKLWHPDMTANEAQVWSRLEQSDYAKPFVRDGRK